MESADLKIRSSAIGKIMTNPRGKNAGGLSATCSTYIKELFLENEYGIVKEFWSRYTDKGKFLEWPAIELANEVCEWNLTTDTILEQQGQQRSFSNEWITGSTDVCTDGILADVKVSWDGTTFPWFADKPTTKDYVYQMQGYMWLTGHSKAHLAYCLINTPHDMVLDEIRRVHWKENAAWDGDENPDIVQNVLSRHNFDRIEKPKRVKQFIIERDDTIIESIKARVEQCRDYYSELLTTV